jgi:hypothetical protein
MPNTSFIAVKFQTSSFNIQIILVGIKSLLFSLIISLTFSSKSSISIFKQKKQSFDLKIDIEDLEEKVKEIIKENNSDLITTKIICILKDDEWN